MTPGVKFTMNAAATASGTGVTIGPKYYMINSTTTGTRTTNWYAQFSGVPAGAANFVVTYKGSNSVTASQNIYIWNWTTSTWFQIAGPTTVGTTDVTVTSAPPIAAPAAYIGTGAYNGQVRVRVLTTGGATNFVTRADFMKLVYDAP